MTVIKILNSPKATIIPCIHEESGCSGLFNTITNEFYPVKTTEFEYIQSAETQYIDTGVQPKGGRMEEYIKREAAIDDLTAKKENATSLCKNETNPQKKCIAWGMASGFTYAIGSIEGIPSADVVEVVRCKDCKYWKCYGGQYADDGECWHLGELDCCMHKDDYCSKGKRKMDKEE